MIALLLFTLLSMTMIFITKRIYGTVVTPFVLTAAPYLALVVLNNTVFTHLGFYRIDDISLALLGLFLVVIFCVSLLFAYIGERTPSGNSVKKQSYFDRIIEGKWWVIFPLFSIGFLAKCMDFLVAVNTYGILDTKGTSSGALAHVASVGVVMAPFVMMYYFKHKRKIYLPIMVLLLLIVMVLYGGKYPVMLLTLQSIFLYILIRGVKPKVALVTGLMAASVTVLMFILIYTVKPLIDNGGYDERLFTDSIEFTFRHLVFYITGPVVAVNDFFISSYGSVADGMAIILAVPINIGLAFTGGGDYIIPVMQNWVQVSPQNQSNVGGVFAESVYLVGVWLAAVYVAIMFAAACFVYNRTALRGKNYALTAYVLSICTLSFFGNFMTVSGVVLPLIYLALIEIILDSNNLKKLKR